MAARGARAEGTRTMNGSKISSVARRLLAVSGDETAASRLLVASLVP